MSGASENQGHPVTLEDPSKKYPIKLIDKEILNDDTRRFRFELPTPDHVLGFQVGQYISLSAEIDGSTVSRYYFPVSGVDDTGFVDFVVKILFKGVNPKYPEGGKMTQYLESMKIGDCIDVSGPGGDLLYTGPGTFSLKKKEVAEAETKIVRKIGMIAGGIGIAPMLQLARHVLKDTQDETELFLIYSNMTEKEILLRDELARMAADHPTRFHLWLTVDTPETDCGYHCGSVDEKMFREHLPPPGDDTFIVTCQSTPMTNCQANLDTLGYQPGSRYCYW